MTSPRISEPRSPLDLSRVRAALSEWGVAPELVQRGVSLERFVAAAGEPALLMLVLYLEGHLPEPFPEDLLAQVETVGELLDFAEVKRDRN